MKDEVALRKLQADGDGAGEEKRIQVNQNYVIKFSLYFPLPYSFPALLV